MLPIGDLLKGLLLGLAAVAIWGVYLATSRAGIAAGLTPTDLLVFRFAPAALIMLPWLLRVGPSDLGGLGWGRGAWLSFCAGPLFILLAAGGYNYAPLSHGAVMQPSTAALASIGMAAVVLRERVPPSRWLGALVIVGGIALIASGSRAERVSATPWLGDLMFMASGMMWGLFTISIRKLEVGGLTATGAVSIVSGLVALPAIAAFGTFGRILQLSWGELAFQLMVHGVLSGVLAIVAFGRAVQLLGAARAAMFPALVPAAALVAGIPIVGVVPSLVEWAGALMATTGLAVAMGAFSRAKPPLASRP